MHSSRSYMPLHYDTELLNLYHELFMKSLKDDDIWKINLDDILKERRIVENEIKGRVCSINDKEGKLRAKGEAYLELYVKVKQVFSQYCHFFAEVESA